MQTADGVQPLIYHVGFNENLRVQNFGFEQPKRLDTSSDVLFEVDVMKLFTGGTTLDIAQLKTVKMDKSDAKVLADNYASMINLID